MHIRTILTSILTAGLLGSALPSPAQAPQFVPVPGMTPATQQTPAADPAPAQPAAPAKPVPPLTGPAKTARTSAPRKQKEVYSGPNTVVVLPPTPMLDVEGKQIIDPDGKPVFNTPVQQIRDKKGHPVFDDKGKPVFQTASNLGYNEKGKKIVAKKVKPPKMTPVSIAAGILTVDGWTGKARLNYDIADLKFLYIYAPGIGTVIVSKDAFPGAKEQPKAFDDKTLTITVEGHPIQLYSEKRLLGKQPVSAWVAVDRTFALNEKFPVFGYGPISRAPYAWPGSKDVVAKQDFLPPDLPKDLQPTQRLSACPAGMMRPASIPGQTVDQPCVPIRTATPASAPPPRTAPSIVPAVPPPAL
jgi:hypothetical protein